MNEIFSFYTQRKFTIFYGYESELRDVQHTSEANKFTSLQLKIYDQTNLRMHEVCKYIFILRNAKWKMEKSETK